MKLEIYKDSLGEWRWRLRSRNGKTVADSGEGYKTKASLMKTLNRLADAEWYMLVADAVETLNREEKKRAPKNP